MNKLEKKIERIKMKMSGNNRELNNVIKRMDQMDRIDNETYDLYNFLRGKNKAYSQCIEDLLRED